MMADQSYLVAGVAGYVGRPDATGDVGVFRRVMTEGSSWQHVLRELETYCVHVHAGRPNVVFAGTQDGIWRSTDHGTTFSRAEFPESQRQIWSFLVDHRDPDRILAGASPLGIFMSEDGGASWTGLPDMGIEEHCKVVFDARVMRMVQHPTRANEIYAALEVNGVARSDDFGRTWTDCSAPLIKLSEQEHLKSKIVSDTFAEGMLDGHAITISPSQPDTVIVALRMGLFQSTDRGASWHDMDIGRFSPTTYGRDIKAAPQNNSTLYAALSVAAASHDGGIYRSTDAGETWRRFDDVQVHGTIMSVALNSRDAGQVFIGARYKGEIFGTLDGGDTWREMPLPGELKDLYCLSCG